MRAQAVVMSIVADCGKSLFVLKLTKGGHPHHPLYLPNATRPSLWHEVT